ncbi:metallophosphoesterase [Paludibaculum fermentans]|uniref:Metallophosphoesterase n=1 Tax=Paludibaculum fermentans TaxID=1473598 RepID=A0A7S7NS70_PALFE|nr:metallophosphoesterase [Paludibaculum fermentans]QOY88289.1 metallophosphoesterase [Paludibaculum fermentans]
MRRRDFIRLAAAVQIPSPARLVAVGDVHGDLDRFVDVLSMAGLVDDAAAWSGGAATLVQLGDVVDRGSKSREVIDFLTVLRKQAARAGGAVHCLIGNHEAMRMYGDFRYVAAAEFQSLATSKSDRERDRLFERDLAKLAGSSSLGDRSDLSLGYRTKWEKEHPLGQAELARAFSPKGAYGKWILTQRATLRLGGTLFVHAGISPKYAEWSETRLNSRAIEELQTGERLDDESLCKDTQGPLWWRGFSTDSESELAPHVEALLAKHQVQRIIVGHTPTANGVVSRLGGKLILADVGLSTAFTARRACVVIENGGAHALDRGRKLQLK